MIIFLLRKELSTQIIIVSTTCKNHYHHGHHQLICKMRKKILSPNFRRTKLEPNNSAKLTSQILNSFVAALLDFYNAQYLPKSNFASCPSNSACFAHWIQISFLSLIFLGAWQVDAHFQLCYLSLCADDGQHLDISFLQACYNCAVYL